jgi:thiosulfate reductase cytochrome b subunit
MKRKRLQYWLQWGLLVLAVLMIVSGLGIADPGIIGPLTLGLMDASSSYALHALLWGPFALLALLHILLALPPGRRN